ncbi:OLC1v1003011C1 [Oldenlandia corymbosa var. corymbosa]|uniref:OLC1v1003011C1 n=1 Tax=Oldenlandia corymbosa var. corymbosa TaxID=529605 RepID=A0AAV1DAB5_OLDCO|nr:OLC1v1003011C1 [Oldenlandia corymbosa var. corymbosa]
MNRATRSTITYLFPMKKKERFETLQKLLEVDETQWHMARPQRVIAKKKKESKSCQRIMTPIDDPCHQVEVPSSVMQRAEAVQENLDAKFPSFIKPMIRSNVTKGFWLSLPKIFCHLHLPSQDATIILEDEHLRQYSTKYLVARRGLSAGWKGFSIAQNLVEGDVLVFHMVKRYKIKVYIIRSSLLNEVDAALSLVCLDTDTKSMDSGHTRTHCRAMEPTGEKRITSAPRNIANIYKAMPDDHIVQEIDQSEKLGLDLQLALNDIISKTRSIATAVEASILIPFSNDSALCNEQMINCKEMLCNLSKIRSQLDRLLSLVLEPRPFYCNGYRDVSYLRIRDRGTAEVDIVVLKETVERLISKVELHKINAEMLELKL